MHASTRSMKPAEEFALQSLHAFRLASYQPEISRRAAEERNDNGKKNADCRLVSSQDRWVFGIWSSLDANKTRLMSHCLSARQREDVFQVFLCNGRCAFSCRVYSWKVAVVAADGSRSLFLMLPQPARGAIDSR